MDVRLIKIEPWPGEHIRGRKTIMVDGVQWGSIHMQSCGPTGVYYTFCENGTGEITEEVASAYPGHSPRNVVIRVWGEKQHFRNLERGEAPKPLDLRLLDMVVVLIENGQLRHPDVVCAAKKKEVEKHRAIIAAENAKTEAAFETKARSVCDDLGVDTSEHLVAVVVAAMKWAQTQ